MQAPRRTREKKDNLPLHAGGEIPRELAGKVGMAKRTTLRPVLFFAKTVETSLAAVLGTINQKVVALRSRCDYYIGSCAVPTCRKL